MPDLTVASFNVHGGVDGWGRPFDVVEACREIGADVLMLQESWAPDGGVSVAEEVASQLGYVVVELAFARGRIAAPQVVGEPQRWGPRLWARSHHGMRLDRRRATVAGHGPPAKSGRVVSGRGTWSIAVMSRLPVTHSQTIDLGQLPTDPARRGAIVMDVDLPGAAPFRVVGTHLAHISQGSPRQIGALRRALKTLVPAPDVLAGDMNLWGPPLALLFPGWSRAVRGRTWPTWWSWPLVQSDHVLVRDAVGASVAVVTGEVLRIAGSDHFPVRASLVIA